MIRRKLKLKGAKQRDLNIDITLIIVESPKCCPLERSGKVLSMQALTQISCVEAVKFIILWKSFHVETEMDFPKRFQASNLLILLYYFFSSLNTDRGFFICASTEH